MCSSLDHEHLSEIIELLGKVEFLDIVETFSQHSRELLSKLEIAQSEDAVMLLHSLKGCCKNMGATAMALRFSDIEIKAKNDELHNLAHILPSLSIELEQTISELKSCIDQ